MTKGKMAIGKTMIYNILHRKLDWSARNALKKTRGWMHVIRANMQLLHHCTHPSC